jgi:F-type H+-transporting ATPase subunit b
MRYRLTLLALPATLLVIPVALLAQEHGAEGGGGGGGLFAINWGLSVWTVVIFTTVLFVLRRFAWGPILAAVEAREKKIQDQLEEALARQTEAGRLLEEHKKELSEARKEAQGILAEGRESADRLRKELESKAREESEGIIKRARAEIEREKDAALDALRREAVDIALAAASKLLHQKLDGEQDRKLVMDYVDGLSTRSPGAEA